VNDELATLQYVVAAVIAAHRVGLEEALGLAGEAVALARFERKEHAIGIRRAREFLEALPG
jgi:hypothetical protein